MVEQRRGSAFFVGIDTYDDDNLPDFSEATSTQDVNRLQYIFNHREFSQYKVAKTLTGRATEKGLKDGLKDFFKSEQCNDFLIYFSGHGYQIDVANYRQGFLATSDCKLAMSGDKIIGQERGFSYQELGEMIADTRLNSLVLILDACHSGHAVTDEIMRASLQLKSGFSYYIIASSLENQESMTDGKRGQGAFTVALIDKLSDPNSGVITADDLFDYGADKLDKSRYLQNPIIISRRYQSIVLIGKPQPKEPIYADAGKTILKNPYQGLNAFDASDLEFFYGREAFVDKIVEQLKTTAFVPIIGASGSGKSSVVKAGLFPELANDGSWELIEFKPGVDPLCTLKINLQQGFASVLNSPESQEILQLFILEPTTEKFDLLLKQIPKEKKFLLLIDQFEETFTLTSQIENPTLQSLARQNQKIFIDIITKVEEPLHIVITMRADFLESCLRFDSLNSLIEDYAIYLSPLRGQALRDAIQKPAERQGFQVETILVDRLEKELANEPEALPLLEFALTKLWESHQQAEEGRKQLTLDDYELLGDRALGEKVSGLKGALNSHANDVYQFSSWEERENPRNSIQLEWIRRIFLQLIRPGQGAKDTRQPQSKESLLQIAGDENTHATERNALSKLVQELVRARLLVTGAPEQKLSTEQIEELTTLERQKWAEDNEVVDLTHEALIEGWLLFSKWRIENGDLLRLRTRIEDQRKVWEEQGCDDNNLLSRGLLAQVKQVTWKELQTYIRDVADAKFYSRSKDYWDGKDIAEKQRNLELQLQVDAARIERQIAAQNPPHEILSAAIQMVGINREYFPNRLIGNVLASLRKVVENTFTSPIHYGHTASITAVAISPDGQTIVSADKTLRIWRMDGTPIGQPLVGHTASVTAVAISPDGQTIVSADKSLRIWRMDGTPIGQPLVGHTSPVTAIAISPDGQTIVSVSHHDDGDVRIWRMDGTPISQLFIKGHKGSDFMMSLAISPDGQTIVSSSTFGPPTVNGSDDNHIYIWSQVGWRSWLRTCLKRLDNNWSYNTEGIVYRTRLFEESYTLAEQGQIELAIDRFKQALQTGKNMLITEGDETPSPEQIEVAAKRLVSPILLHQGQYLARNGNYNAALAKFEQAKELDSRSILDPQTEAKRLTAPILKMQVTFAAMNGKIPEAIAKFEEARQCGFDLEFEPEAEAKRLVAPILVERGKEMVKGGQVQEALDSYKLAQDYNSVLEISAADWNTLLRLGSLHAATQNKNKLIKELLEVSQEALGTESENYSYRDTLGVAKVLAGAKLRWKSAIKDFEFFIEKTNSADDKEQRQRWIAALKEGQNPLTEDEIKTLLEQ